MEITDKTCSVAKSGDNDSAFVVVALPIDAAAVSAGVTRTRIFQAVSSGDLCARKAGKQTIIEIEELKRWVRSLPHRGRAPETVAAA